MESIAPVYPNAMVGTRSFPGMARHGKRGRLLTLCGYRLKGIRIRSIQRWLSTVGLPSVYAQNREMINDATTFDAGQKLATIIPSQRKRSAVFICYAHEDQEHNDWKNRLVRLLRGIPSIGESLIWDDSRIKAVGDWRKEIKYALERSKVAILLVGPCFMTSEFINTDELPHLMQASGKTGIEFIPLITDYVPYEHSKLARYKSFNLPEEPLESLSRPEQNRVLNELGAEVLGRFSRIDSKNP